MAKKNTARKTRKKEPVKAEKKQTIDSEVKDIIGVVILLAVTVVAYMQMGAAGTFLNRLCRFLFGKLYFVILGVFVVQILVTMINRNNGNTRSKNPVAVIFIVLAILLVCAYTDTPKDLSGFDVIRTYLQNAASFFSDEPAMEPAGGVIGALLFSITTGIVDRIGTILIVIVLFVIAALLLVNLQVYKQAFRTVWTYLSTRDEDEEETDDPEETEEEDDIDDDIFEEVPFEPEMIEPVRTLPSAKEQPRIRMLMADDQKEPLPVEPIPQDTFDDTPEPLSGFADAAAAPSGSKIGILADGPDQASERSTQWTTELTSFRAKPNPGASGSAEPLQHTQVSGSKASFFSVDELRETDRVSSAAQETAPQSPNPEAVRQDRLFFERTEEETYEPADDRTPVTQQDLEGGPIFARRPGPMKSSRIPTASPARRPSSETPVEYHFSENLRPFSTNEDDAPVAEGKKTEEEPVMQEMDREVPEEMTADEPEIAKQEPVTPKITWMKPDDVPEWDPLNRQSEAERRSQPFYSGNYASSDAGTASAAPYEYNRPSAPAGSPYEPQRPDVSLNPRGAGSGAYGSAYPAYSAPHPSSIPSQAQTPYPNSYPNSNPASYPASAQNPYPEDMRYRAPYPGKENYPNAFRRPSEPVREPSVNPYGAGWNPYGAAVPYGNGQNEFRSNAVSGPYPDQYGGYPGSVPASAPSADVSYGQKSGSASFNPYGAMLYSSQPAMQNPSVNRSGPSQQPAAQERFQTETPYVYQHARRNRRVDGGYHAPVQNWQTAAPVAASETVPMAPAPNPVLSQQPVTAPSFAQGNIVSPTAARQQPEITAQPAVQSERTNMVQPAVQQSTQPVQPERVNEPAEPVSRPVQVNAHNAQEVTPGAQSQGFAPQPEDTTVYPTQPEAAVEKKPKKPYQLPALSLLDPIPPRPKDDVNEIAAKEKGGLLIQALRNFDIEARLINTHIGPAVTKFEIRPDANVKVSRIQGLADDIKMQLAVRDVRIEAPIPGLNAVGVEIPNQKATPVKMRELFGNLPDGDQEPLLIVLGKDLLGQTVTCRLDKMPHLMIAGATGSGKSVCMNSIITSLLLRTKPENVKMLLVDPKKVEFTPYQRIPHLIGPVINDPTQANNALKVIVKIMDERYDCFAKAGVRNIQGYNKMVSELGPVNPDGSPAPKKMPYIVVIVDEMADLMNVAGKEVESSIQRITQLARAAGIHLIIATQRPSTDVITGVIKSNIPSRIAFAVSSGIDSRTILDHVGAERLLGNGDMLYMPIGVSNATRVQGVFITDDEVKRITDFVSAEAVPMYDDSFIRLEGVNDGEGGVGGVAGAAEDPLFDEIREYVVDVQKASTSLLQRRFGIGYNRAARMIDLLEEKGVIGPAQGSKPREVYVKKDDDAAE